MSSATPSLQTAVAVTRFGLGARPGEIAAAASDPRGWITDQIRPEGADLPPGDWPDARSRLVALRDYRQQVKELRTEYGQGRKSLAAPVAFATGSRPSVAPVLASATSPVGVLTAEQAADGPSADFKAAQQQFRRALNDETSAEVLARARLAAATPAGFRERWALFWSNHFTTAGKNEEMQTLSPVFEREAIRPHVFGRFSALLAASTTHPGMLHYLDQVRSIGAHSPAGLRNDKAGLNENLAREILELHTVGPEAGYTQADVTEFARVLTGLTVGGERPEGEFGLAVFREDRHEPGPRTIMGRRYADNGPATVGAVLDALAADPRTARRISRKIAAHFVADDPPAGLCARLERAWLRSDGDLAQVARALVAADEAWEPAARKLKTSYEFLISTWRSADVLPADPRRDVLQPLTALAQRPFYAPQPNFWSDTAATWAGPDAVLKRLTWAEEFAAAHAGTGDPRELARQSLGARLSAPTALAVSRAESRPEAFAILVMSPEFQRR